MKQLLRTMFRSNPRKWSYVRWPFHPSYRSFLAAQTHMTGGTMWPLTVNKVIASQRRRRYK